MPRRFLLGLVFVHRCGALAWLDAEGFTATRSPSNPIIHAELPGLAELGEEGKNINGPSVIRVPDWVEGRLGRYYLYFASHTGSFIRLAYAASVDGPWTIHPGGVLHLSHFPICHGHIASPDAVVEDRQIWRLFFHCVVRQRAAIPMDWDSRSQCTAAVSSTDGLRFAAPAGAPHRFLGPFYFRVFRHAGAVYALAKRRGPGGGVLYRCPRPTVAECAAAPFSRGPQVVENMRHAAVVKANEKLLVFFSRVGDAPESIYARTLDLHGDWLSWGEQAGPDRLVLEPRERYEGAHLPVVASPSGPSKGEARQLRDPAVLKEGDGLVLFYAVAGEHGLAVARLRPAAPTTAAGPGPQQRVARGPLSAEGSPAEAQHTEPKVAIPRTTELLATAVGTPRVYSGDARGWWWWLQEPVGLTAVLIAVTCLALGLLRAFGRTA